MNIPETVLLLSFLAGLPAAALLFARIGYRRREALLAAAAGRWKARVRPTWLRFGSKLEIEVDGVAGEVTFSDHGNRLSHPQGWTAVRLNWPSERRLRVAPMGFVNKVRRLFGASDIEFDDPPFDDRFWVESSHPVWARGLLTPTARQAFVAFMAPRSDDVPPHVMLDVGPAGLSLRLNRVLVDNRVSLGTLVELAVAVLQKARGAVEAAGVTFEPLQPRQGSSCPTCGHPVTDMALTCPTCRTPHHLDCWKYLGGCAIFGCSPRRR